MYICVHMHYAGQYMRRTAYTAPCACAYVCVCMFMCACIGVCMYMHYARVCVQCQRVCMYVCTYVHGFVFMYAACMCMYMCTYVYALCQSVHVRVCIIREFACSTESLSLSEILKNTIAHCYT